MTDRYPIALPGGGAGGDIPDSPEDIGAAPAVHTHDEGDVDGLTAALAGKADSGHDHDGDYAAAGHTHSAAQVTGLAAVATSGAYSDLSGTPAIPDSPDDIGAAAASHTHTAAQVSGLAISDISGLQSALEALDQRLTALETEES